MLKTINIIRCRRCNGEYFGNDTRLTLHPGNENTLPDELTVIVRTVPRCTSCKQLEGRTKGGVKKKYRR